MTTTYPATLDDDASLHQLVNDLNTTTSASYTSPATTLDLTDASAFPSTGGIIYVNNERGSYTGKTGNQLTGITGLGNNHSAGVTVEQNIDAFHHNDLKDAVVAIETKIGVTGSAVAGTVHKRLTDLEAADANFLQDSDLGVTVQAYDADTSKTDVAETRSASLNMADNELIRAKLKDTSEVLVAKGNTTATCSFDYNDAGVFTATLDQASTFTFINPPASGSAGFFTLELTNGGAFTITWPTSVDWEGGTAPSLTASGVDLIGFYTRDAGITWHGFVGSTDSR